MSACPNVRNSPPGFRAEAVELAISSQKSLVEVAASLGIYEGILGNWVRAYRAEHPEAETEERGPVEWAQYKLLRKELLEVKREIDFLKECVMSRHSGNNPVSSHR